MTMTLSDLLDLASSPKVSSVAGISLANALNSAKQANASKAVERLF